MSAAYLQAPVVLPSVMIPFWCAGKERFDSAILAHMIATKDRDKPRTHYRCHSCGGFHVATAGREGIKNARAKGLIR